MEKNNLPQSSSDKNLSSLDVNGNSEYAVPVTVPPPRRRRRSLTDAVHSYPVVDGTGYAVPKLFFDNPAPDLAHANVSRSTNTAPPRPPPPKPSRLTMSSSVSESSPSPNLSSSILSPCDRPRPPPPPPPPNRSQSTEPTYQKPTAYVKPMAKPKIAVIPVILRRPRDIPVPPRPISASDETRGGSLHRSGAFSVSTHGHVTRAPPIATYDDSDDETDDETTLDYVTEIQQRRSKIATLNPRGLQQLPGYAPTPGVQRSASVAAVQRRISVLSALPYRPPLPPPPRPPRPSLPSTAPASDDERFYLHVLVMDGCGNTLFCNPQDSDDLSDKHIALLAFPDVDIEGDFDSDATKPLMCGAAADDQYTLVITTDSGDRLYGFCSRFMSAPPDQTLRLACVLSTFNEPTMYFKVVNFLKSQWLMIEDATKDHRQLLMAKLENSLKQMYNQRIIAAGKQLDLSANEILTQISRPVDPRAEFCPTAIIDLGFTLVVSVLASLLLERRVLLISRSLTRLSHTMHSLAALLYPCTWPHAFVTALPRSLLDILCCPAPFFIGLLDPDAYAAASQLPMEQTLIVHIDDRRLLRSNGDEMKILPRRLLNIVRASYPDGISPHRQSNFFVVTTAYPPKKPPLDILNESAENRRMGQQIKRAYLGLFVRSLWRLLQLNAHLPPECGGTAGAAPVVDAKTLIAALPENAKSRKRFLNWFTETQMFGGLVMRLHAHFAWLPDGGGQLAQQRDTLVKYADGAVRCAATELREHRRQLMLDDAFFGPFVAASVERMGDEVGRDGFTQRLRSMGVQLRKKLNSSNFV